MSTSESQVRFPFSGKPVYGICARMGPRKQKLTRNFGVISLACYKPIPSNKLSCSPYHPTPNSPWLPNTITKNRQILKLILMPKLLYHQPVI